MKTLFVTPAPGRRVRTGDGRRHIRAEGETVALSTYYRRRLAAGDLVAGTETDADAAEGAPSLEDALRALEEGNPDHWTEAGKPDLNHLSDVLNRRVTRREVEQAMKKKTEA